MRVIKTIEPVIITINPLEVTRQIIVPHGVNGQGLTKNSPTYIVDEEWGMVDFKKRHAYQGCYDRFVKKKGWQSTRYYQLRVTGRYGKTKGVENTMAYLKRVDSLYEKIKNGTLVEDTYTGVVITKSGEVTWWFDGQHRLSICKILGVKELKAKAILIHHSIVDSVLKNKV